MVIAIIGILAALLLPAISKSKTQAHQIQCAGNLRQLGLGLQSFVGDNHAYPSGLGSTNSNNPGTWIAQLERGGFDVSKPRSNFYSAGVWRCPSAQLNRDRRDVSYGYNSDGVGGSRTNALGLMGHFISFSEWFSPISESEVIAPNDMMAIGDSLAGGVFFYRGGLDYLNLNGRAFLRHQGEVNVVFCDGHVESPTLKRLFADTNDVALVRWNRDHQPHRERLGP
jgi:prepilin-type processing-associated H-X9-DG protein